MFNIIIAILTTSAIAVHAVLGCCAHHSHACDSHATCHETSAGKSTDSHVHNHCDHDHGAHQHHQTRAVEFHPSSSHSSRTHSECPGQHHHSPHENCDEGDCNYIAIKRDDVQLMLSFSKWVQGLSSSAVAVPCDGMLAESSAENDPPDLLTQCVSARSSTQVWRL